MIPMKQFSEKDYSETIEFLQARLPEAPEIFIILGSGLGFLADRLESAVTIPYTDIPHFVRSTAPGHKGRLVFGHLGGRRVLAMQGRFHLYEGYSPQEAAYPVRIAHMLGARKAIISCACGGVSHKLVPGDLCLITDYINFTQTSSLVGEPAMEAKSIFVDVSRVFDPQLMQLAKSVAGRQGLLLKEGVYFYMSGPQFETPAEIRAIRALGSDLVGMSLVHEAIMAAKVGMQTVALGLVTNMAAGMSNESLSEDDIFMQSDRSADTFGSLVCGILEEM